MLSGRIQRRNLFINLFLKYIQNLYIEKYKQVNAVIYEIKQWSRVQASNVLR